MPPGTSSHPRPRLLMCPPRHFGVEYIINPWMEGHVGLARREVALAQWQHLHDRIAAGAPVALAEPGPGLPDMAFVANAGLVLDEIFIPSVFRVPQRRPEMPGYRAFFEQAGFEIRELPDDQPFEGEGDALFHCGQPLLWAGYGVRSGLESHMTLAQMLHIEVLSLRLVDQRFYHLDTCFMPLPGANPGSGGRILYYPPAFDDQSLKTIHRRIPAQDRLAVAQEDALHFACNALVLGRTIFLNHASADLRQHLSDWGFTVEVSLVDEFILAGGAVKCLCLHLQHEMPPVGTRPAAPPCPIRESRLELSGHLLDTGLMNTIMDRVTDGGGSFQVEMFQAAERHDQQSTARLRISAPTSDRLELILAQLLPLGARLAAEEVDARLEPVLQAGVAPDDFYSTTIYPTEVRIKGQWLRATGQRMDAVLATPGSAPAPGSGPAPTPGIPLAFGVASGGTSGEGVQVRCTLIRDLQPGQQVVCGVAGVRVQVPPNHHGQGEFSFMSASVSSERRVERVVDELAWEMRRIKARGGRIIVAAGPVVIHTGGGPHLARLIRHGYVQALLTGNALPVHDIESSLYGTSLGVDLARGVGVHGGHQHHLRAINTVRRAGGIREAVAQGLITSGVMYECVQAGIPFILAGSIRDDGPLPDTLMDLEKAQAAYADTIRGADMILMLASMLHAIGTGNMTPSGVRIVCVDISPAVVTKLADRGSVESTGIVTDVGLFLNLLAARLV